LEKIYKISHGKILEAISKQPPFLRVELKMPRSAAHEAEY
jgi:hypothetical protein